MGEVIPEVKELVEAVSKMPPPPPLPSMEPIPMDKIRCACGSIKDATIARLFHTGVVQACEAICSGCRKDYAGRAKIVCCSCRQIVGWLIPHKDKSGFEYKPDGVYHTETCGFCNFEAEDATIIEKFLYEKALRGDKGPVISLRSKSKKV